VIVIDASAVVELVLDTDLGRRVADRLRFEGELAAPAHLDVEVVSALRRAQLGSWLTARDAAIALIDFGRLAIERVACAPLNHRVLQLRHAMTAGDGFYVALAEALDSTLVTTDLRLAGSNGHNAVIEALSDQP
jgi:predicted nucleic acid-binding protein